MAKKSKIDSSLQTVIDICEDHKAGDVVVFDVSEKSSVADFYVFCTGNSETHLRALAAHLYKEMKEKHNMVPRSTEGTPSSRWILVDFDNILVHLFHPAVRKRYAVESLHKDSPILHKPAGWEFPEAEDDADPRDKRSTKEEDDELPAFLFRK